MFCISCCVSIGTNTPDLMYRLWANFQCDIHGNVLNIPWVAVADLLLSGLCNEVGHELYEMEVDVRNKLLRQLENDPRFGRQRLYELSDFLLDYVQQQLNSSDPYSAPHMRDFAQTQQWTALAYTQPSEAARELALAISNLNKKNSAELIRLASVVETFAEPLAGFGPLLAYASSMARYVRGDLNGAAEKLIKVVTENKHLISVAGVALLIPKVLHKYVLKKTKEITSKRKLGKSLKKTASSKRISKEPRPKKAQIVSEAPQQLNLFPYPRTDKFINREQEIAEVEQALNRIIDTRTPEFQGYLYWGIPGIGKSRMLRHIEAVCRNKALSPAWIDFAAPNWGSHLDYLFYLAGQFERRQSGRFFRDTLEEIARRFTEPKQQLDKVLEEFARGVKQRLGDEPLVLFMDSCELCPADFFDWIGAQFLALLRNTHVVPIALFLASRCSQVAASRWPPEMIRATTAHHLRPFDLQATQEHIAAIDLPPRCQGKEKDIHQLSSGHPFSTEAVVYFLQTLDVAVSDFPRQRELLARRLYDEVIHRYLCAGVETWEQVFFDIACIPRRFDAILLEKIAPNHNHHQYTAGLQDLLRPAVNLIEAEQGKLGFFLDGTLRRLLHTAVSILQPERGLELNQQLKDFYESELTGDAAISRPTATALLEFFYHHIQVEILSNHRLERSAPKWLEARLREHFYPEQDDDALQIDRLRILLDRDAELNEILGRATVQRLLKTIARFLQSPRQPAVTHLIIRHRPPSAYQIGCYAGNPALRDLQTLHTHVKFPLPEWRASPKETGTAAFKIYLTDQAKAILTKRKRQAIVLTTDTMDIPFELMHDGKQFLCLSRPFSRRMELKGAPKQFEALPAEACRALVVGNPTGDLPRAEDEARAVIAVLENFGARVDRCLGRGRNHLNRVVKLLTQHRYQLIHFAGHGFFNKREPTLSGLLFDKKKKMMISADELERLLQGPAFIFFSACCAAAAEPETTQISFQGKFVQNLALAALKGGACGCLGPMWEIEDGTAGDFALAFYAQLLRGSGIGKAVWQARRRVSRRVTDCWASWVLFGDPFMDPLSTLRV